jgi:phasin protein
LAVPTAKAVFSRIWNGTSQRRLRLVLVVDRHRSWSLVMSKRKLAPASKRAANSRKPATTSKGSGRPKVVARAQRNKQALVRSPRDKRLPPVTGGSPEPLVESADQKQENSSIENRAAALQAILLSALQEGFTRKTREVSEPMKGLDFASLISNMQAYQAKLVELAQANMQFTLEFAQRLATIRSPLEFIAVIAEFTGRRMLMVGKHSREMTAVLTRR